jgi:uncharacterized membrane-anchored protein YitT (DUF2179 family)/predicted metal-dependent HD superfamily phosphohydrolase
MTMQYDKVHSFLIKKLEKGLPPTLTYHNVQHTQGVIAAAEHLASLDNLMGDELVLLKTAALFHDSGFLQSQYEHEANSCTIARRYLPDYGYTEEQIERICRLIMTTKLPQSADDYLSQILCDADLYYLGGNEYDLYANKLYKELKRNKVVKTEIEWQLKQAEFLSSHHYFSKAAQHERDEAKQQNLQRLQESIAVALSPHKENNPLSTASDIFSIILGVIISGIAYKGFLVPNHFFDGGVSGISLLVSNIYHFNLSLLIILLNLPLIVASYFTVGKRFALRTLLSIILLSICLLLLPEFALTSDKLLISIFGGIFLGIGIGLAMRGGAALDGIDVLALYTFKKTSFSITEIIMALNILIFAIAAFKFGIETALYSILTYFAATFSADYVAEGIQAYTGVTIVSGKSEVIKYQLVNQLGRAITVYKGERGFIPGKFDGSTHCDIIFMVVTRLEMRKLKNLVYEIDSNAFIFASNIKEASGGIISRKQGH